MWGDIARLAQLGHLVRARGRARVKDWIRLRVRVRVRVRGSRLG